MVKKVSLKVPEKLKKSNPDYAQAIAKFWMVVASIFIGFNMFFVLTLMQMAPRLTVVPLVLSKEPMHSLELIQAESFDTNIADKRLIDEMMIRYYLTERYTRFADAQEMQNKWGPWGTVALLSTPQVYQEFYQSLGEITENVQQMPYSQGIDIRTIKRTGKTWTVEFDLYKMAQGIINKETRVAVLESAETPYRRAFRLKNTNPYGFIIINYTDAVKKQSIS